jgi:hypothetical protein
MPMAGCERCGRVDSVPGFPDAVIGRTWDCPECGRPLRWVGIVDAVTLLRERHDGGLRRASAIDRDEATRSASAVPSV